MMVVGDFNGRVGAALGKAASVPDAVRKGRQNAERAMQPIVTKEGTIPHEVYAKYGSAKVLLLPAAPGTGVIAGGGVRAVIEAAGIQDVLSKTYGGNNPVNSVRATLKALSMLRDPQTERARRLGLTGVHTPSPSAGVEDSETEDSENGSLVGEQSPEDVSNVESSSDVSTETEVSKSEQD